MLTLWGYRAMINRLRVEIPDLPPKEANPNWHGHWAPKARAIKDFREMAMYCAINACQGMPPFFMKAKVGITLIIKDTRYYRDPDNALASLKPAIDGCCDAGIILSDDNKHLEYSLPIIYEVNREEAPKTILEFIQI